MTRNGWGWLKWPEMAAHCWIWLEIALNGMKPGSRPGKITKGTNGIQKILKHFIGIWQQKSQLITQ